MFINYSLTLLLFMFLFILNEKTSENVTKIFIFLQETLGRTLYKNFLESFLQIEDWSLQTLTQLKRIIKLEEKLLISSIATLMLLTKKVQ